LSDKAIQRAGKSLRNDATSNINYWDDFYHSKSSTAKGMKLLLDELNNAEVFH
jgi:hypothetical protein